MATRRADRGDTPNPCPGGAVARAAAGAAHSAVSRSPEQTLLHVVVREQLETFLARARATEAAVPRFVEQELRAFLRCGVLAHGFLRLRCDVCGHERLVAFSCKRRGFCPSCGGRRMADTAAHLVDRVLPAVPIRQWVLTLPHSLRYRCAYDARLASDVLRAFVRSLFSELRRRARNHWNLRLEQCGAVTFVQRFGSAMNLNLHFHTLALDGVFPYALSRDREPRFFPLPAPGPGDVARVLAGTARRIRRLLEQRAGSDEDALARDEPLLAAASLGSRTATGPRRGEPWRRLGDRVDPAGDAEGGQGAATPSRVPQLGGMSLHAGVAVPANDRRRLERLCRYVGRPPLANDRLEERPDGTLTLRLKTPWRDGTTHLVMERSELLERLVPLIPPPRAHQVRCHGILAPGASLRDRVTPGGRADGSAGRRRAERDLGLRERVSDAAGDRAPAGFLLEEPFAPGVTNEADRTNRATDGSPETNPSHAEPRGRARRLRWAALLQRVFGIDALRCPHCGSKMRLLAAIEDPVVARKILACLGLPARAPPLAPVSGDPRHSVHDEAPAEGDREFDQTPVEDDP